MDKITIRGVTLGDHFMPPGKRKDIYTVTDFVERKNVRTGEIIGYEVWAEHDILGQKITSETCFSTVLRYKIKS